jgi:uncharacterized membrane protein
VTDTETPPATDPGIAPADSDTSDPPAAGIAPADTDAGPTDTAVDTAPPDPHSAADDQPTSPPSLDDVGRGLLDAEMGPSSSLAHLYRGEIHRMKFWRERLDTTSRWAIMIMAAILTWTFASPDNPHYILLFAGVELILFAGIEAHRFRGYDVWRSRVRALQRNVFAPGLDPDGVPPEAGWRERLADHYREPHLFIPFEEALAHRLRRVYLPQFGIVLAAWLIRITVYRPSPAWPESAAIGHLSGVVVTAIVALIALGTLIIAFRPRHWHADREVAADGL